MNTSNNSIYSYDELFYVYQRQGSARSARTVLPHLVNVLGVRSVLDVGCGAGAWLAEYNKLGVSDILGVDGEYVDRSVLLIDPKSFVPRDIGQPFDFQRTFDLVQCLEVGEHVATNASGQLVDNIVRHGKRILFSAAVPGQGGENHINEQPYEFWRDLFRKRGYRLYDFLRPAVRDAVEVEPWYRYNMLFFAHDDVAAELPHAIASCRIPDEAAIKDVSPISYKLQKTITRLLPDSAVSGLAIVKHKLVMRSLRRNGVNR